MALGCVEGVCLGFIANSIAIAPTVYSVPPPPSTRSFGQGQPGRQGAGGAWRLERGILRNARARRGGGGGANGQFAIRTLQFGLSPDRHCLNPLYLRKARIVFQVYGPPPSTRGARRWGKRSNCNSYFPRYSEPPQLASSTWPLCRGSVRSFWKPKVRPSPGGFWPWLCWLGPTYG